MKLKRLFPLIALCVLGCETTKTTTGKDGSVTVVTTKADGKAIAEVNTLTGLALQLWLATHPVVQPVPVAK